MKILLISEGDHELGDSRRVPEASGALEVIVRKILNCEIQCTPRLIKDDRIRDHRSAGKGGGYFKLFVACIRCAEKEGFDAVVVVVDHDDADRDRLLQAAAAQADDTVNKPRAIGVAIRSFDAWMLADHAAISTALNCRVDMIGSIESHKSPKQHFRQLRDGAGDSGRIRDLYARVAELARLEVLESSCPAGFKPFAENVRTLLPASRS
jgi:hypothetical protein